MYCETKESETFVATVGFPTEIRSQYFLNRSPQRYRYRYRVTAVESQLTSVLFIVILEYRVLWRHNTSSADGEDPCLRPFTL